MRKQGGRVGMRTLAAAGLVALPGVVQGQVINRELALTDQCAVGFDEFCGCGKASALRLRAAAGLPIFEDQPAITGGYTSREVSTDTDLLTVDLDIDVNPTTEVISGSNTMRVRSLVNGLTQFTFRLRSNFTISETLINGTFIAGAPAATGSYGRTVTLDRAYNAGEEFTIRVTYSGVAVSRGFGSIEFGTQNGNPIIATLSEAYFAGTWWPVKDGDFGQPGDNGDKSIGSIAVTVPDTLKVVSNGLLTSETVPAAGKKRFRWTTNYPTSTYLYAFCATNYNQWTRTYTYPLPGGGTGTMPVEFSIYPANDNATNRANWEKTLNMLPVFRTMFGEYPFINEKYGIYQFPFGGGMEHQTYTGQGTFNESVTAHELGHQWWGDDVTCKTWNHIWLNEGFATYTEALWEERKPGSSGLPALHAAMAARRPSPVTGTVYVPDGTNGVGNMNRIFSSNYSYRKGGWVLHTLRNTIGDAAFFETLLAYRAMFTGRGATTDDFAGVVSSVVGQDMMPYFAGWVYGTGAPAYAYGFQPVTINGERYTRVHVRQTQDASWGSGGVFHTVMDLQLDHSTGSQMARGANGARLQHYLIPTPGVTTTGVTIDPSDWILNTGKVEEAYINGPAKVIGASVAPGASLASAPASLAVMFSEGVSATAGSYSIVGPSGPAAFTHSYHAPTFTSTLTFTGALTPGEYTVTVSSSITTVASGMALDGELDGGTDDPTPWPSGNGIPGGSTVWRFTIQGPSCVADVDDGTGTGTPDGGVTIEDLLYYLGIFDAGSIVADVDDGSSTGTPDGGVTIDDLLYFLFRFDAGC